MIQEKVTRLNLDDSHTFVFHIFPHPTKSAFRKTNTTRVNFEKSRVTTSFSRYSVNSLCLESAQRVALCRACNYKLSLYASFAPSPSRGSTRWRSYVLARGGRFSRFD